MVTKSLSHLGLRVALAAGVTLLQHVVFGEPSPAAPAAKPVSYYKEIRPLFQAQCQGCHQPAKAKGGYVMTDFERLLAAGDSQDKPIVPGKPDESHLVKQITPTKGEAEMPKGKPPLMETEIALVRRWIQEGAQDDTPANAKRHYDAEHPPIYTRPPIIAAVDVSPQGNTIALSGFHEVLLHHSTGEGLQGRLIGLSERIQSLRFSPDGKRLAVAGGQPSRMGEIQVWDVESRKLQLSVPVGYDTLYGVSWSPDGKLIAFGCPDRTVRAIDATSGKQVLQQGSHNDWVLGTVFSKDGSHIVSVGRDMSAKLTETASQRFIDNITSITPGALRGGLQSVARHPLRDEVLVGGADGVPQIYQMFRQAARKIGDNATLLRRFPEMEGRIFSVDYSPNGEQIAACASLDAHGTIRLYAAKFDSTIPTNILKAYEKEVSGYSAEERKAIETFVTSEVKLLHSIAFTNSAIYHLRYHPTRPELVAVGSDGMVHLVDTEQGRLKKSFAAAPALQETPALSGMAVASEIVSKETTAEALPKDVRVVKISAQPSEIKARRAGEHTQILVTATLDNGDEIDATRMVDYQIPKTLGQVSRSGKFTPKAPGQDRLKIQLQNQTTEIPVHLEEFQPTFAADFIQDVNPILSKLGCNAGTCHGAKDGKNGFKLSLRGYDPVYDIRAFTDDLGARRINLASPDDSLLLLKATGAVPHEGGQRTTLDSEYYAVLRQWILQGAGVRLTTPRVTSIEILPKDPVVQEIGAKQQLRIVANYADGKRRDVTAESFVESGNGDVATANQTGLVTTLRRGEAPILARYEGAYAATTVTVMGDRTGFTWKDVPYNNHVDELVAAKWKRMKILPSDLCSDAEFLRRAALDLTGLPPTAEMVREFSSDTRSTLMKRNDLIDRLIGSPEFIDFWANKWADLLQVNRKFLGEEGARAFREWIRREVELNTPYDQFVRKIITATGSTKENPAASYYKILRTPTETMENTTHLFLATRFNCNKCHDHPFERWTQDQYYEMSAFFARVGLKPDPASGDRRIGGSAVESSRPLYEFVTDEDQGDMKHDRTGKVTEPGFPYPASFNTAVTHQSRREKLAAWMTSRDNRYFALSYVNRLWGYLMGVGLIDPLDDIRAGNPPSNPALLDYLTQEFVNSGFNTRHLIRQICQSRTYQLSVASHAWNSDDRINYSHATPRRLPAEVLLDAVFKVTGSPSQFPGAKPGTRAVQLTDSSVDVPSGFLANLGRPARESACECERSSDIRLGSIMALLSGPTVSTAVNDPKNEIAALVQNQKDDKALFNEIYLRILNRPADTKELDVAQHMMSQLEIEYQELTNQWAKAETQWAERRKELEMRRKKDLETTEKQIAEHLMTQAPLVAAAQRDRRERITAADEAVKESEFRLESRLALWEASLPPARFETTWLPVDPKEVKGSGSARLEKLADGSIRSTGTQGELPDYTITAEVGAGPITGIKIEALTDEVLPGFGPGHKDGAFVLSELIVEAGSRTNASKLAAVNIVQGQASYVEKGYDLKQVFDGKAEQGKAEGWSIGGAGGKPHWAAFAFEKPVERPEGSTLRITLRHRFQAPHEVGRFRIWVSGSAKPAAEGLPAEIADLARVSAVARTPQQTSRLLAYYRTVDDEIRMKDQQLSVARRPLPADSKLKELQARLEQLSRPILTEPSLVQLRRDVELSAQQLSHKRLTVAQDLTWALINTPSFLFNR